MANVYTWVVDGMKCKPNEGDKSNLVIEVHWRLNGTDGQYSASCYGSVGIPYIANSTYTPYENLTEAQVIGWVKNVLGAEAVAVEEANIAGQLQARAKKPVVTPELPWSN